MIEGTQPGEEHVENGETVEPTGAWGFEADAFGENDGPGAFERASASLYVALASAHSAEKGEPGSVADPYEPMPEHVSERVRAMAAAWSDPSRVAGASSPHANEHATQTGPIAFIHPGWYAAAAALVLATFAWVYAASRPAMLTPEQARTQMLQDGGPQIIQASWGEGDVIWDPEKQEGFMRLRTLRPLDPEKQTYQLWIFDAERPTGQLPQFGEGALSQIPVNGGVFQVNPSGETVVHFEAHPHVKQAIAFAITVEQAGGVDISDREDVPLVAMVQ